MNSHSAEPLSKIPYSHEIEGQILGCLMNKNELFERLHFVKPEYFHSAVHRRIFEVSREEVESGRIAQPLTIGPKFKDDPAFEQCDPRRYLMSLYANPAIHPEDMAEHLTELYQRRQLGEYCEDLQTKLDGGEGLSTDHAFSLMEKCERLIDGEHDFKIRNGEEVCQSISEEMNRNLQPFSTGLADLDDCMDGGLYPGKSYGFAARKKVGKTIMAGTISHNLAVSGVKHLFVCGEMSPEEIHQRTLARVGGFYPSSFRNGFKNSPAFAKQFAESVNWQQKNILYSNSPGLTFDKLRRTIKRAIIQHKIKGFILDYWQLVGGKDGRKSTAEHLDEVAQWIADTCRKHRIWSITMAQINQEGNTRGGEGIRLAFDQVYQIHRPTNDEKSPYVWLEMLDTRYTKWMNVGSDDMQKIHLNEKGPFFEVMP